MKQTSKIWLALLLVVILLIAVYAVIRLRKPVTPAGLTSTGQTSQQPDAKRQLQIEPMEDAQVPGGFPANLPWESGAKVLQNFQAKDPSGNTAQSFRAFISDKSLADNFALYQKYLKDNGWTTVSSLDQTALKRLSATKGSSRLEITISHDSSFDKTVVNVSAMQLGG